MAGVPLMAAVACGAACRPVIQPSIDGLDEKSRCLGINARPTTRRSSTTTAESVETAVAALRHAGFLNA